MKTREEQLKEMVKAMCEEYGTDTCNECSAQCFCANKNIAENLYAAGYRKQSDTVREFVEKINALAAEYGVEVGE